MSNLSKNKKLNDLYLSWKNKTRPNTRWKMTGDMIGRLDWMINLFQGIESITELGPFQGCSTTAWLACGPKKLTTIDINQNIDVNEFSIISKELGIDFKFVLADDLKIEIEETDLLFIDTMHTDEHTYQELKLHAGKARKFLAFHDVNPQRFGTQAGIDRYLKENPNLWTTKYHDINDCGFLILERI